MSKSKKLVPRRRFKEFLNAGDWEQRKLGEVVDVRSGKDYKHLSEGNIPVYGTGGYMLSVNEALSYDEDAVGIGRKGTIDNPYLLKAPFWTVDTLFYAVARENMDLDFAFDIFQNIDWKKKDESTGVPSLSKTAINEIEVMTPQYDEQCFIGAYFDQIDHLITLHQCKLEKMNVLKAAYLSEMFPVEGERKPRRRFKGFTDDWEQRKLGEVVTIKSGMSPSMFEEGRELYVKVDDLNDSYREQNDTQMKVMENIKCNKVKRGSIIFPKRGAAIMTNKVRIMGISGYMDTNMMALEPLNISNEYLYLIINKIGLFKIADTSTIPQINNKHIEPYEIPIPNLDEQRRIGTFFRSLDHLITLHRRTLEKLQNIKKAYLNEMFPGGEQ